MVERIEDLTVAHRENGVDITKELGKQVLTKGAWTTIMFRYQDWDEAKQAFGPVKYTIRRYQKRNNQYWQKSKFNISSVEQAKKIVDVLSQWLDKESC